MIHDGCTRYLPVPIKPCKDRLAQQLLDSSDGFFIVYSSGTMTKTNRCGVHATNVAASGGAFGAFETVGVCVGRVGVWVVDRHGQPHPCLVLVPAGRRQTDLGRTYTLAMGTKR